MKKSVLLLSGILLATFFVSMHLYSNTLVLPDDDPPNVELSVKEVKVFPNPSDGRFKLTFEYSGQEKINARVFDITGKQIKDISDELDISEGSVTADVDLESPSSGIYFIRIERGKFSLTKKIVIR